MISSADFGSELADTNNVGNGEGFDVVGDSGVLTFPALLLLPPPALPPGMMVPTALVVALVSFEPSTYITTEAVTEPATH